MANKEMQNIDDFLEDFDFIEDWEDRYLFLMEKGRELPPIDEKMKIPANIVEGCQSRVWLMAVPDGDLLYFQSDSDSQIVKGLVAVVLMFFNGHSAEEISRMDIVPVFERMELERHLSGNRSNGLKAMVQKIKSIANSYQKG
jgi:cysteine desulfuration protein SufE